MKFKKVEIQAFRAYNKAVDATFDFSLENGETKEVADFISIYAPNGFGKTSFYDAVEYGVTDSIGRLIKGKINKDIAKSERAINNKPQFILRNRFSPPTLQSKIKIETTDNNTIEKEISSKIRANGTDFHFDESKVKNKYFQTVILSQEWIDAFLKVDEPTERYNKFMDFFGDRHAAEYLKCLTNLISSNNKNVDELKKSLSGVQKKLDFTGDKDILAKVNDKIVELNAKGESISAIDERFSDVQSIALSNRILERISDIKFEIGSNESQVNYVDKIFSGFDEIVALERYFQLKEYIQKLISDQTALNLSLENFNQLHATENTLAYYVELQSKLTLEKENLEAIIKVMPAYRQLLKDIADIQNSILQDEASVKVLESEIVLLDNSKDVLKNSLQTLADEQIKLEELINKIPDLEKIYVSSIENLKKLQDDLLDDKLNTAGVEATIAQNQSEFDWISGLIANIKLDIFPTVFEAKNYVDKIKDLEKLEEKILKVKNNLAAVESKIRENENLSFELEQFVVLGSSLVEKAQTNTCLLCNAQYASFEELSSKIIGSKFLSSIVSDLLAQKSILDANFGSLVKDLNEKKKDFEVLLEQDLKIKAQKLVQDRRILEGLREQIDALQLKHAAENAIIQNHIVLFKGMSTEAFVDDTNGKLQNIIKDIEKLSVEFSDLEKQIADKRVNVSSLKEKTDKNKDRIDSNKANPTYVQTLQYLSANGLTKVTNLKNILIEILEKIESAKKEHENLLTKKDELENILKSITREDVLTRNELNAAEQHRTASIVIKFEKEVENRLNIRPEEFSQEAFVALLNERKSKAKLLIEDQVLLIKNFELLQSLRDSVEPYLKYADAKKTEEEIKNRIKILSKKVRDSLNAEKEKVVKIIEDQIQAFFYEPLINDLYRRIDPHPDYKKIRFICDFKDDKPKLNVYLLREDDQKDTIIPNLYFSTAQLNILSLSIFLAKALNAKDDEGKSIDCIFIDDPIQSMDSINILSTIDLIRSLVVNENKQIILSTHDENFHSLLQKKIPSNYFKSKFLKLETFGKLEAN